MKKILLLAIGSAVLSLPVWSQALTHVRLETPGARELSTYLEQSGFDVVEGSVEEGSLELVVSDASMSRILAMGYLPEVLAVGRPFSEIQAERDAGSGGDPDAPPPPGYPNLAAVYAEMQAAAANFPSICLFVDLTATYGTPPTWEGRSLFAIKISDNVALDEDEPAALVVSEHHARELITPVIALHALDQFTTLYGSDPTITSIVNANEIWIAPVWNPDGYEYVFNVNNLWRKNRHVFGGGVGVDLNRNYPFGWSSGCAGSTSVGSDEYKGPSPASEAETMTLIAWSEDVRFAKIIDYHSFGEETLWEYACHTHPLASFLSAEATVLSQMSGYGATRPPSAEGEHYEWQLATYGNHAFLIETGTAFQPSFASAQAEAAQVFPGIEWLLARPISVSGNVTDLQTGLPVEASITYKGFTFQNGETNTSDPATGRYHAFLPNGPHTLTFSASGYRTQSISRLVSSSTGQVVDVELVPLGFCPAASATNRNQSPNPNVYTATRPVIGQPVTFTVNTQGFQFATIIGVGNPSLRSLDAGWALIDVDSQILFLLGPLSGPIAQTTQVIANNPSMCGMYIYSQAKLHNTSGPFVVTNAQDLLLGN